MKFAHLSRYGDLAGLLIRYHSAIGIQADDETSGPLEEDLSADGANLARDLEKRGPTFIKFGQLLSTRADLLPRAYLQQLRRLQDDATPLPFAQVREVVESELGTRLHRAFAWFEERPTAAASLGQVHHAALRDDRQVAVKVQRPGVHETIQEDLEVLSELAAFADSHTGIGRQLGFEAMVEEFRLSLLAELDYRAEVRNLEAVGSNLDQYERIIVPKPIASYSTMTLLTMEWIEATNLGSLGTLARAELDGGELAEELFRAYLDQMLVDGVFHADPHPGNVALTNDGRLALLDLGMVGRIAPNLREALLKMLLAVSQGRGEVVADVLAGLGEHLEDFRGDELRRGIDNVVQRSTGKLVRDLQTGALIVEVLGVAGACGLRPPSELTLVGKTLLNLDETARILDADFEPGAAIERHLDDLVTHKIRETLSPTNVLSTALEVRAFAEHFPGRVNRVLDNLAEGEITLKIQGIDESQLMRGIQKLANRLALGALAAALVIAAAITLASPIHPRVLGAPVASFVLFGLAMAVAVWMAVGIALSDLPQYRAGGRARRRALMRHKM